MSDEPKNPLREIVQPFIDLVHAPRALWGINLGYLIEGFVYGGVLTYLAMYFVKYVFQGAVEDPDVPAHYMVGVLTAGITIAMFFFGGLADRWGVRRAIIIAFILMAVGRSLLALGPTIGLPPGGWLSGIHLLALGGILLTVLGYGMYQPAAYAAVRQFTTEKNAAMGYAMLYALMNLGWWLPSFLSPVRQRYDIDGAYWLMVGFTLLALLATVIILSPQTVRRAIADAKTQQAPDKSDTAEEPPQDKKDAGESPSPSEATGKSVNLWQWLKNHPLANAKFSYFIFALIPVQTLFTYNWFILPQYVARAYRGTWTGDHFEAAANFTPILIFILVPIVTAVTQKRKVYNMMVVGTFIMAAPSFLLVIGPSFWTLLGFLVIMATGEAMWSPRFLQYAAEIAPEGRTGAYMGVAQFPWFLTKVIAPLYSGHVMARYCPEQGPQNTEMMWLIFGGIAMGSTVLLILAKGWVGKDFKTKAD